MPTPRSRKLSMAATAVAVVLLAAVSVLVLSDDRRSGGLLRRAEAAQAPAPAQPARASVPSSDPSLPPASTVRLPESSGDMPTF